MLSHVERSELHRQLKGASKVGLIRPCHNEFGSPFLFVSKVFGSLLLGIDYRGMGAGLGVSRCLRR
jgi:hypothetical protein